MKHPYRFFLLSLLTIFGMLFFVKAYVWYSQYRDVQIETKRKDDAILAVLSARERDHVAGESEDPFGDDDFVRVLFIGLDNRAGEEHGHCDAIQMIEIDREKETVVITAVPRGSYAPLPPGKGTTSTDYYLSNSCALGGLEYGIENIERILQKDADFIVVVGFSEAFGILRQFDLPPTETVQWLRNRQGYAIGEPQRAHNHSTFLKHALTSYLPDDVSVFSKALQYIVYTRLQTDLSFPQGEAIVKAFIAMDLHEHPERITLAMKPWYPVQDIMFDPESIEEHLKETVGRISGWLSKKDYSGMSKEEVQQQLLLTIDEQKEDEAFVLWAYEHDLWLQIEDDDSRQQVQWRIMTSYLDMIETEQREEILADYILEMEHLGLSEWEEKGKGALLELLER